jgi:hypothetical protein
MSNDHLILFDKIRALMQTHPADLLPCHRYLLTHNFQSLGSSKTIQRQILVALMEPALSAAAQVTLGCFTPGSLAFLIRLHSPCAYAGHPTIHNTRFVFGHLLPTVSNNKHSQHPFGSPHDQLHLQQNLLMSTLLTSQECTTISTGKENRQP